MWLDVVCRHWNFDGTFIRKERPATIGNLDKNAMIAIVTVII
jgi:hypothetical protein